MDKTTNKKPEGVHLRNINSFEITAGYAMANVRSAQLNYGGDKEVILSHMKTIKSDAFNKIEAASKQGISSIELVTYRSSSIDATPRRPIPQWAYTAQHMLVVEFITKGYNAESTLHHNENGVDALHLRISWSIREGGKWV